jgi:pyruvate/2-oxoglutarate dehydrogenase complex dihydrolipoamide dehydrogenase (E3) component
LGGRFEAAFQTSFKEELRSVVQYYETVLKAIGVKIRLGEKVTIDRASQLRPDVIVIATGSVPLLPDVPGVHLSHVVQALDILLGKVRIEGKVGVIGGGTVGCEVAIFLAERGVKVTIMEMLPYVAYGIPRLLGKMMREMMRNLGVHIMTNQKVVQIMKDQVVYEDSQKKRSSLPVNWVVLAVGSRPKDDLVKPMKDLFQETYLVGDCIEPRKALEAICEGAKVGLQL